MKTFVTNVTSLSSSVYNKTQIKIKKLNIFFQTCFWFFKLHLRIFWDLIITFFAMLSLIWVSEFKKACEFFLFSADKKIWNLDKSANPNMSSLFVFTFLTFIHSSSHPYFLHPFILTSILSSSHLYSLSASHPFILPIFQYF